MTATRPAGSDVAGFTDLLWPRPALVHSGRPQRIPATAAYVALPDLTAPRLLVPAGSRRAAARALATQSGGTWAARLRARTAAAAFAVGLGPLLFPHRLSVLDADGGAETIESFLRDALGRDVVLSIYLGRTRANRKPVLQLFSPDGHALGFAKIGVNDLTRSLVRAEAAALDGLAAAPFTHLGVADVVLLDRWNGLDILVMSALPVPARRRPPSPARLAAAARDVTTTVPLQRLPLAGWLPASGLLDRLSALPDAAATELLRTSVARLLDRAGDVELTCGAWHGDWAPWNMAAARPAVLVWDWERFGACAPVGFDPLHYELQRAVVLDRQPPRRAAAALVDRAPALLRGYDVDPVAAPVVALAYLVELATRYLTDQQDEAGARFGRVDEWLLPVLSAYVARLANSTT